MTAVATQPERGRQMKLLCECCLDCLGKCQVRLLSVWPRLMGFQWFIVLWNTLDKITRAENQIWNTCACSNDNNHLHLAHEAPFKNKVSKTELKVFNFISPVPYHSQALNMESGSKPHSYKASSSHQEQALQGKSKHRIHRVCGKKKVESFDFFHAILW